MLSRLSRLHASAHAWAHDTATDVTIAAIRAPDDPGIEVTALVAEPGPMIAMKLSRAPTCSTSSPSPSTKQPAQPRFTRSDRSIQPSHKTFHVTSNSG